MNTTRQNAAARARAIAAVRGESATRTARIRPAAHLDGSASECTVCGFNWFAFRGESPDFCYHCIDMAVEGSNEEIDEYLWDCAAQEGGAANTREAWTRCLAYVEAMQTGVEA